MSEYVLRTSGLSKSFSGKLALNDVNLEIEKGSVYGFIGKNGAGKTTLMRVVCGLAAASKGSVELFGQSSPESLLKARRRLGSLIEMPSLYRSMTAYDNLEVQRRSLGLPKDSTLIKNALETVGLADTGKKKVKAFSLGMKQRLGMALALLNNPELMLLDEPINGLDPVGIAEVRDTLKKLSERGITILISSHILSELHLLATNYGIIDNGVLIKQQSAKQLDMDCRQYVKLVTNDAVRTDNILKTKLNLTNYKVLPDNEFHIFDCADKIEVITAALATEGIGIRNISALGQDLETYFISLLGGAKVGGGER